MVKLYYTPTSCGKASFIAAFITGSQIETEQVDIGKHVTASGADFYAINPKGNVPTLVLDDGTVLNEGSAVLQAIADLKPGTVAPENGTSARYLVQTVLNYTASEVHGTCGHLFNPTLPADVRTYILSRYALKLKYLEENIVKGKKFVVGDSFSIADSYLWVVLSWCPYLKIDLEPYPNVKAYCDGISNLDSVKAAVAAMEKSPSKLGA